MNPSLELNSYSNCHPNLLESEFESSTIQFGTPNCLSLADSVLSVINDNYGMITSIMRVNSNLILTEDERESN